MMEKENMEKMGEVTTFLKLPVYTRNGTYVGHVKNVFLDIEDKRVSSLLVTNTNPSIVEGSADVAVPYRWVNAVGDIVILSNFPERVITHRKEDDDTACAEDESKEIDMIK